jgi:hypothetical protein
LDRTPVEGRLVAKALAFRILARLPHPGKRQEFAMEQSPGDCSGARNSMTLRTLVKREPREENGDHLMEWKVVEEEDEMHLAKMTSYMCGLMTPWMA